MNQALQRAANQVSRLVVICLVAAGFSGCTHGLGRADKSLAAAELKQNKAQHGLWRAKALVFDAAGKQRTLSLDLAAEAPNRLRIDATTSLGVYVGTFVSDGKNFAWLSALEKKFVVGAAGSRAARTQIGLPVDAEDVVAALLNAPMPTGWTCELGADHSRNCTHATAHASASMTPDQDGRRFVFTGPNGPKPAQLRVDAARTDVDLDPDSFRLAKPKGYSETVIAP